MSILLLCMSVLFCPAKAAELPDIGLNTDFTAQEVNGKFRAGSHVKLFIPNLPYLAISHAINGALLRPSNSKKGWQYDLATSYHNDGDKVWEFELRKDAYFQDGSHFNADSVLENMKYFKKKPFTFTKLHTILERVEKVDDYRVRFYLREPYGVFLHDAIWLQFYTPAYLQKFGWNGKPNCPNLAEPGPYALGPYILTKGYIEGDRSSSEVVLKANPNYWGEDKPKVETITIYTDISLSQARVDTLYNESKVDLTPVAFAHQVDTVLAPYSKLAISPSMNSYAMHFNMISGNAAIQDDRIRYVINHAINQEYLLNLSMLGEGELSPTMVSPNFYRVDEALATLDEYFVNSTLPQNGKLEALRGIVKEYQKENDLDPDQPLRLTLLAQESFMFLIRDIQYFLQQVNIQLDIEMVDSEKQVFHQLLSTWKQKNERQWDLLMWGNYDWYKHPWSSFFVYRPGTAWSTIPSNPQLISLTDRLASTAMESDEYVPLLAELIRNVYEHNYMVFLPTPNNVYAINKEVLFNPGRSAFIYLRDLQVTDWHWSVREDREYPTDRQHPLLINRQNFTGSSYE